MPPLINRFLGLWRERSDAREISQALRVIELMQRVYRVENPSLNFFDGRQSQKEHLEKAARASTLRKSTPGSLEFAEVPRDASNEAIDADWYQEASQILADPRMSKYENPSWYWILKSICHELEELIRRKNLPLPKKPLFATLDTGQVNGLALDCRLRRHYIVFLETGLFAFFDLFSRVLAHLPRPVGLRGQTKFSFTEKDIVENLKDTGQSALFRLNDVLFAYLANGHAYFARPYVPPEEMLKLANRLCRYMEMFVVAHEYSHCIRGHLEHGKGVGRSPSHFRKLSGGGVVPLEELSPHDHASEHEADILGANLVLGIVAANKDDPKMAYAAIEFGVFCYSDLGAVGIASAVWADSRH